ncbi:MAG: hypothetical protein K6F95_12475 [Selenomonas sp.]|uniref:hypothetical protein n=1 Tax=Selenomonas sp. TaxID=2053611 RepID=UPI0025CD4BF1|nr:hypothetical protein [Selenomonas sp.]MCR5758700.1 hypothetical protein [Selenomonas sp.]
MDVKMPVLPHDAMDVLKSQQNNLISTITTVKTENQAAARGLPPLHSLMTSLDAVQGAGELEKIGHAPPPAFVVDINSERKEFDEYATGAFTIELSR